MDVTEFEMLLWKTKRNMISTFLNFFTFLAVKI